MRRYSIWSVFEQPMLVQEHLEPRQQTGQPRFGQQIIPLGELQIAENLRRQPKLTAARHSELDEPIWLRFV
jgi:hypothetical protein